MPAIIPPAIGLAPPTIGMPATPIPANMPPETAAGALSVLTTPIPANMPPETAAGALSVLTTPIPANMPPETAAGGVAPPKNENAEPPGVPISILGKPPLPKSAGSPPLGTPLAEAMPPMPLRMPPGMPPAMLPGMPPMPLRMPTMPSAATPPVEGGVIGGSAAAGAAAMPGDGDGVVAGAPPPEFATEPDRDPKLFEVVLGQEVHILDGLNVVLDEDVNELIEAVAAKEGVKILLELAQLLLLHLALHVHERVGASLPERGPMSGQPIFGHREGESLALELRLRLGGLGLPALSYHRGSSDVPFIPPFASACAPPKKENAEPPGPSAPTPPLPAAESVLTTPIPANMPPVTAAGALSVLTTPIPANMPPVTAAGALSVLTTPIPANMPPETAAGALSVLTTPIPANMPPKTAAGGGALAPALSCAKTSALSGGGSGGGRAVGASAMPPNMLEGGEPKSPGAGGAAGGAGGGDGFTAIPPNMSPALADASRKIQVQIGLQQGILGVLHRDTQLIAEGLHERKRHLRRHFVARAALLSNTTSDSGHADAPSDAVTKFEVEFSHINSHEPRGDPPMSQFGADLAALAGNGADATRAWDIGDAALAGDVAALQSAIEAGADVNSANDRGAHPLMLAAHDANVECVSLLLQSGADAHRATRKGRTALHVATTRRALWVKGHGSFIAKPPPADDAAIARIIAQFDEVIDLLESHAIDKAVAECAAAQLRGGRLPPPPQLMAPIFPPIAAFSGGAGSGNPPYKPVQEREQVAGAPGQVYQYCSISKMDQYQSKSFEELRYEDYAKGNTGATPGAAALG
eukprot:jgi/Chrpa1/18283/Chrysochromulina_OHIO_Genome00018816-RA